MIEKSAKVAQQLKDNVKLLRADNCQVINDDAMRF